MNSIQDIAHKAGANHRLRGALAAARQRSSRYFGWWPGATLLGSTNPPPSFSIGGFARADMPAPDIVLPRLTDPGLDIKLLTSPADLDRVVSLRKAVYARHERPIDIRGEAVDTAARSAVLGALGNDGELFASMRVSFSQDGGEAWFDKYRLPESYRSGTLASFERLAIDGGGMRAAHARQALFKVAFLLALGSSVDYIVISTVTPLNCLFESFGFTSAFGDGRQIKLDWFGEPQHILVLRANDSGLSLLKANRAWYDHIVTSDPALDGVLDQYYAKCGVSIKVEPVATSIRQMTWV
ncbi:MAG: hypothetical protein ABWZ78_08395 [Burkholderiaceae bacterium]